MAKEVDTEMGDLNQITDILMKHDKETRTRMVFYLMAKFKPEKKVVLPFMKPSGKI